jgi:hypothetical protein
MLVRYWRRTSEAALDFKLNSKKLIGAMAVELIREALQDEGIPVSSRDVFVRGTPHEIDLIIPRPNSTPPLYGILYEPEQVAVALEIRSHGSFGKDMLKGLRDCFTGLTELGVACAYITIKERTNYIYRATEESIGGFRCFTVGWYRGNNAPEASDEWPRFVYFLRQHITTYSLPV